MKYGPLNLRRRAGAVAPFEVGTFSPYQATTATDVGSVLEQVKPSYTQTETVVFSVAGPALTCRRCVWTPRFWTPRPE